MGSHRQPLEFDESFKALTAASAKEAANTKLTFINESKGETSDSLPIVDFSALTSDDQDQRSIAVHILAQACEQWGFFILVNHGISETLLRSVIKETRGFFDLKPDERNQYEAKSASDPIQYSDRVDVSYGSEKPFTMWRYYLFMHAHPRFHCPTKPQSMREPLLEYIGEAREVARKLIGALAVDVLELEERHVFESLGLDSSWQLYTANLYPPCPEPDRAIGIPPHTDTGLLTLLIQNGVSGLEIEHNGRWFKADSPESSILVNVADQLEIFSNGRCKSVSHRVVLNDHSERISIALTYGPSFDSVVGPAEPLVQRDGGADYRSMRYGDYNEAKMTEGRVDAGRLHRKML